MNKIIEITYDAGNVTIIRENGKVKVYPYVSRTTVDRLVQIYRHILYGDKGKIQPRKNGFSVYPQG